MYYTMESLIELDRQLLLALNGSSSIIWDGLWMTITSTTTWLLLYATLLGLIIRTYNWNRVAIIIILTALLILLVDQGASGFCKPYFHRLRPTHEPLLQGQVQTVDGYVGGLYGFISSHAANTFALATFFALIIRHWASTLTLYTYAMLTSFSRIYLGVHYPGDVLCGALYGIICAVIIYILYLILSRRIAGTRKYYSNTYTSSGILKDESTLIPLSFAITLIYIIFRALIRAI